MNGLIRDPAEWARESGYVSRLRAERAATRLRALGDIIVGALGEDDEAAKWWADELEAVANYLAPRRKKP